MKRNIVTFLVVLAVLAFMLTAVLVRRKSVSGASGAALNIGHVVGQAAPEFELATLDGKKLKLSDLRGKAVLLNFWATWCAPCKAEMPWFVDLQKQYSAEGLEVVGVAMDDASDADIAKFAHDMGVNYTIVRGSEQVADQYGGVQYLPTTFYINRNGAITERTSGIVNRKEAEENVQKALASTEAPAAPANTVPNSAVPHRAPEGARP